MATITTFSIQSGSNGNCIYVEAGETRLLFDAGVSGRCLVERMEGRGRHPRDVHALIISHEHTDHCRSAATFQRRFGMPAYATKKTAQKLEGARRCPNTVRSFAAGSSFTVGEVTIHALPTPHDAVDGVAFIIEFDGRKLGIFTDLGHVTSAMDEWIACVDACYLESNHDPLRLAVCAYPPWLKRRIAGPGGHISNIEAAELVQSAIHPRLAWVALAHLSAESNDPEQALLTHRTIVGREVPALVAPRDQASRLLTV